MTIVSMPDQQAHIRISELARILAAGVLRLHKRQLLADVPTNENAPNSSLPRLDVPPKTVLSVHSG